MNNNFKYEIFDLDADCNHTFIDMHDMNDYIKKNNIKNIKILKTPDFIGDCFLANCSKLESIDLSPLSNVTAIGDLFLYNCRNLKSIDLSPLSNVRKINNCFLSDCSNLKSIDLSPLSNVTKIGNCFLHGCSNSLESINSRGIEWFEHPKKEEYQQNYDKMIYNKMLPIRKEFMKEYGLAWELMAVVWHPHNFHKFKYLDPDTFADL